MLDFRVISPDSADTYLAEGLAEELTTRLGQVNRLKVTSRVGVKRLRNATALSVSDIGRALNAAFLVTGSVRRAGSRVRVSVELLRATDGVQRWQHQFDPGPADILEVQEQVGADVASAIAGELLPAERRTLSARSTRNPLAQEAYLGALTVWRAQNETHDFGWAVDQLNHSIRRDSSFASAYALLAMVHSAMFWWYEDHTEQRLALARRAADRAALLAPNAPETFTARGYLAYWGRRDYEGALREFGSAIQRNPSNVDAWHGMALVNRRLGRWDDAIRNYLKQNELDPLNGSNHSDLGDTYLAARRYPEAVAAYERSTARGDVGFGVPLAEARAYLLDGNADSAATTIARALRQGRLQYAFTPTGWGFTYLQPLVRMDTGLARAILLAPAPASRPDQAVWHMMRGQALSVTGRPTDARPSYESARAIADSLLSTRPDDHAFHALLAQALARLGDTVESRKHARRSVEVLPVAVDAVVGPQRLLDLIEVEILIGDNESAIDHVEQALSIPSQLTAAWLRRDPLYDSLRGNARFQRLIR